MKQSLYIGILVALQLVGALIIQLMVLKTVGLGVNTDSFTAAQAVPMVVSAILAVSLQSFWFPRFSRHSSNDAVFLTELGIAQGQALISACAFLILLSLSASIWVSLIFPGFQKEQVYIVEHFTRILLIATIFNTLSGLLSLALKAKNRFLASELIAVLGTLFSIAAVYFVVPVYGVSAAVWILLIRSLLVYIIYMYLFNWPLISLVKGFQFKKGFKLMRPVFVSSLFYKTSPLIDRFWGSQAGTGGLTILNLSLTAVGAFTTVVERSISAPIMPQLSRHLGVGDYQGFKLLYKRKLTHIILFVVFVTVTLLFTKGLIVTLLSSVLSFDYQSSLSLYLMCILLMGYVAASTAGSIIVSAFYAMEDTKTPTRVGMLGFFLSIPIKSIGYLTYGLPGLVFATSIYYILNGLILFFILEKKLKYELSA